MYVHGVTDNVPADAAEAPAEEQRRLMKVTVEFKSDKGEVRVVTFDEATGVSTLGTHATKFRRNGNVIDVENTPEGPLTLTMDDAAPQVGHATRYVTSAGEIGTARVLSVA